MFFAWWWVWMIVIFALCLGPVGYGWGYRGWGPPYPSYIQRRRHERAVAGGAPTSFNHYSWGWGADLIWVLFVVAIIWAAAAFWMR